MDDLVLCTTAPIEQKGNGQHKIQKINKGHLLTCELKCSIWEHIMMMICVQASKPVPEILPDLFLLQCPQCQLM